MTKKFTEVELQRKYYAETAEAYEKLHVHQTDEHFIALSWLAAMIEHYQFQSVLDVGSGTGRCLHYLKEKFPNLHVVGIEPSTELRKIGYEAGLSQAELIDGDATNLAFADNSFDVVCDLEFCTTLGNQGKQSPKCCGLQRGVSLFQTTITSQVAHSLIDFQKDY